MDTTHTPRRLPVRRLTCCCCGGATRGVQWWNRDAGYGLCPKCAAWITARSDYDAEDFTRRYGVAGIHHSIDGDRD